MSHSRIAELLPWYVNATLEESERREVEGHLAACPECAGEIRQLRALGAALREDTERAADPSAFPRLWDRIQAERSASPGARLAEWWAGLWGPLPLVARGALVAQLAVIVGLGALLARRGEGPPAFETVSGPAATQVRGARIALAFAPGVSEEQARRTIVEIGGVIVAGPSALGLYTVEVPIPPDRTTEVDAMLERLRRERVVRFAARQY